MSTQKINAEIRRLSDLMERGSVPQLQRDALAPVIENLAWMRFKLDEARADLKNAGLTCSYDNGGGQSGIRENPIFKSYLNLWRGYITGLEKLQAALPKDLQEEAAGGSITILDQVRQLRASP